MFDQPVVLSLALTLSLSLGNSTSFAVFTYTEVEKGQMSVSAIHEFITDRSHDEKSYKEPWPPKGWPTTGDVVMEHLRFSYVEGDEILKDVSLNVPQGKKLAIIGRTGSGNL